MECAACGESCRVSEFSRNQRRKGSAAQCARCVALRTQGSAPTVETITSQSELSHHALAEGTLIQDRSDAIQRKELTVESRVTVAGR